MINRFDEDYRFLNNSFTCPVTFEGMSFISVEHAFQASKTLNTNERVHIAHIGTAREVIAYGRKLRPHAGWEEVPVRENLLRQKFSNPEMREKLIATGEEDLVDGGDWLTHVEDLFWKYDLKRDRGENWNGRLITKIRSGL